MSSPQPLSNANTGGGREGEVFISVSELRERLRLPEMERPRVVDARVERQYLVGHLPGALNLPARDLNPVEEGVRTLLQGEQFFRIAGWLGFEAGVGEAAGDEVVPELVLYGARGGADAAHLWWTLRAFGVEQARLLDGGVEAWQADGGQLVVGPGESASWGVGQGPAEESETVPDRNAQAREQGRGRADAVRAPDVAVHPRLVRMEELIRRLDDPDLAIVDTREPEEYRGEMVAAKRGGHIPGAVLLPWTASLTPDLSLRPESELRELLAPILSKPEAIIYCQSGVRAAHTAAVLVMLGHPRVRLYLGSWGEWGNREETPVEVEENS